MPNLMNKRGQGIVEYIMLVALVAVAVVAGVRFFSGALNGKFMAKAAEITTW